MEKPHAIQVGEILEIVDEGGIPARVELKQWVVRTRWLEECVQKLGMLNIQANVKLAAVEKENKELKDLLLDRSLERNSLEYTCKRVAIRLREMAVQMPIRPDPDLLRRELLKAYEDLMRPHSYPKGGDT